LYGGTTKDTHKQTYRGVAGVNFQRQLPSFALRPGSGLLPALIVVLANAASWGFSIPARSISNATLRRRRKLVAAGRDANGKQKKENEENLGLVNQIKTYFTPVERIFNRYTSDRHWRKYKSPLGGSTEQNKAAQTKCPSRSPSHNAYYPLERGTATVVFNFRGG